ncbi:MAG: 4-(cytidine 5'-diphospho)-2-C-methyl-D-erythritol kinase [Solirubrobacteraceae bacterium]
MKVTALAPGKVNICLFLGPVRADGRHQLITLMESLSLADELTLETAAGGPDTVICPGVEGRNLVSDALAALRSRGWDGPPVRVTIVKRIPLAAGMGGGSADAAATLRLAGEVAAVPADLRAAVAASLGSDVPGLLDPGLMFATGAGEVVQHVPALASHAFAIVPQPFGLSTAEVYAEADRMDLARSPGRLAQLRVELAAALGPGAALPAEMLVNDLQPAALSLAPQIEQTLRAVLAAGADHSFVCGSGPTVAGLFWGPRGLRRAAAAAASLAPEYPGAVAASPLPGPIDGSSRPHLRGGAQSVGVQ